MKYRTVGIFAHIDSGKTTLTERILFEAGKISAVGSIEDGNTESDSLQEEIERGISIRTTFHSIPWNTQFGEFQIELVDTPGHIDFRNQVTDLLPAMESAIVVLEAGTVVQSQARLVIEELRKANVPMIFFINKLDRFDEDYLDTLVSLEEILGGAPVSLFQKDPEGKIEYYLNAPGHFPRSVKEELMAWSDEILLSSWNDPSGQTDYSLIGLRSGPRFGKLYPVYGGSAKTGEGVRELLDLVLWTEPKEMENLSDSSFPLLVLSRRSDPEIGRFAVVCPTQNILLTEIESVWNQTSKREILNQQKLFQEKGPVDFPFQFLDPDSEENISQLQKGKLVLLKNHKDLILLPGQTVADSLDAISVELGKSSESSPSPFSLVLEPEESSDKEFWLCRLEELVWEDPGYQVQKKEDTGQLVLHGRGELHLEIGIRRVMERTEKKLKVSSINIAKIELLKKMSHKVALEHRAFEDQKSSGALIAVLEDTADFSKHIAFEVSLPEEVKNSIETSFMEACLHGFYGEEVVGLKFRVLSYEIPKGDLQITLTLLKVAILAGVKELFSLNTYLVGPLTEVEVMVDADHLGVVLSDLSRRNAKVVSILEAVAGKSHLKANAPAQNLLGFSGALRNMTKGIGISWERTAFTYEFHAVLKE
ncbi:elongation factor G-like protein [Leptospira sp. 2 VSF19]|uniref:Elongation factor G-like protein n=1 Tax=Leptospira soteropolitanensis TaxID=2950025 RepID=A0AAW5VKG5_9LEPT|nr:elongation factor G-like protein [Leptospira soteropolitanensis]MCW7493223.1 elongation factor G-like protein [Leptospira soteropolitanensis]MCW7500708.1 elongation factor G-like protein [Leptospira soteropolitanensis]MCW7523073.1 elongation factor G-like protein [Leptospira soteropolitanensis]MCW7526820.1 elongation factor G-like protein [Leptospira soteropolitanensis]MCW7530791.1 elongation factor G-like protein [Leptospira soteropolitanensis]